VAVDTLTGEYRLRRVDILHDAAVAEPGDRYRPDRGRLRPGHGLADHRGTVVGRHGRLRTHAPSTYKIPTARDVPPVFITKLLENAPNAKPTIFRSKAVGEPPFMLAIACFLAVQEAIAAAAGWPAALTLTAPATPEAVLRALSAELRQGAVLFAGA
jgi:xanthine dehydrogenase large subunit